MKNFIQSPLNQDKRRTLFRENINIYSIDFDLEREVMEYKYLYPLTWNQTALMYLITLNEHLSQLKTSVKLNLWFFWSCKEGKKVLQ